MYVNNSESKYTYTDILISFSFRRYPIHLRYHLLVLDIKVRRYRAFVYATHMATNPIHFDKASMVQATPIFVVTLCESVFGAAICRRIQFRVVS
jgi:hypothetical protein